MVAQDSGRNTAGHRKISKSGYKEVLLRTKDDIGKDNLSIVAAGMAFYILLAIFPAIGAMVALYGLIADPAQIQQQLSALSGILPQQAMSILENQFSRVSSGQSGLLSFGAVFGLLFALWSAAKGMKALVTGLNIVYDVEDKRGFFKLNAIALLLTIGAVLFAAFSLGFIVAFPALMGIIGLTEITRILINIFRWPLLAIFIIIGIALLYRYAPNRKNPDFRWFSWGSVTATLLWILFSGLFSFYVSNFGSYNETYGSIGAVIILLMWFYITAFVILLGAELNSEMDHQIRKNATPGEPSGG